MKCPANTTNSNPDACWMALNFNQAESHYCRPLYSGTPGVAKFTAEAELDLGCNAIIATFRRVDQVNAASGDAYSFNTAVGNETE